eukprot:TRINITY_DN15564_c0_g1_i1.p1 TRINITY_DN15564_c0_g1~~TRINITY_DN15564_c0_g1_i1.p1  ORF type:complete len:1033 (+),score=321.04 TRINITY_DN15564_c0_g1_i1:105-3101(+)
MRGDLTVSTFAGLTSPRWLDRGVDQEPPMSPVENYLRTQSPLGAPMDFARQQLVSAGARFPARGVLQMMPDALRKEVVTIARERLRLRLVPLLRLWLARQRRKELNATWHEQYKVLEVMKSSELFQLWPEHHVARLATHARRMVCSALSIVMYEGETWASGIWCLVQGTAHVLKRGATTKRVAGRHPQNAILNRLDAPAVAGDFTQVTGQPRTATILSLTDTHWGVIPSAFFHAELKRVPDSVKQKVYDVTFTKQRAVMWTMFPLTHAEMRRSFLFEHFHTEQLNNVIRRLRSRCFKSGDILCHFGDTGSHMFFLRNGRVEILIPAPDALKSVLAVQKQSGDRRASSVQHVPLSLLRCVKVLEAGSCFGEMSLIFGEKRSATVRATRHCDVFTLALPDLEKAFYEDRDLHSKVHEAASAQRNQWLKHQEVIWKARSMAREVGQPSGEEEEFDELLMQISNCPVLRDVCSRACLTHLRACCSPRCVTQRSAVISSADICDRILIITRGKAIVQQTKSLQRQYLHVGEPVGYTCLAEHRWLHAVVAVEVCDVWELPRSKLIEVLKVHGCHERALRIVRALLRGDQVLLASLQQKTPPLFPTSRDKNAHKLLGYSAGTSARGKISVDRPSRPSDVIEEDATRLRVLKRQHEAGQLTAAPEVRRVSLPPALIPVPGQKEKPRQVSLLSAMSLFESAPATDPSEPRQQDRQRNGETPRTAVVDASRPSSRRASLQLPEPQPEPERDPEAERAARELARAEAARSRAERRKSMRRLLGLPADAAPPPAQVPLAPPGYVLPYAEQSAVRAEAEAAARERGRSRSAPLPTKKRKKKQSPRPLRAERPELVRLAAQYSRRHPLAALAPISPLSAAGSSRAGRSSSPPPGRAEPLCAPCTASAEGPREAPRKRPDPGAAPRPASCPPIASLRELAAATWHRAVAAPLASPPPVAAQKRAPVWIQPPGRCVGVPRPASVASRGCARMAVAGGGADPELAALHAARRLQL